MKVKITVEHIERLTDWVEVTEDELKEILNDESEILDRMYEEVTTSKYVDNEWNFRVEDEKGREL